MIGIGDSVTIDRRARLGEIYLRVGQIDLDDPDAILAFASEYGPLTGAVLSFLENHSFFAGLAQLRFEPGEYEAIIASEHPPESGILAVTMLRSFVTTARLIRDLTTAWEVINLNPRFETEPVAWELDTRENSPAHHDPTFYALELLRVGLNGLLSRLHPFVRPTSPPDDYEPDDDNVAPARPGEGAYVHAPHQLPFLILEEICGLELYNHIAKGDTYRKCKNERCQQRFVRQYGRSDHGGTPKQNILYCSSGCARAQAQRDYRRRKKTSNATKELSPADPDNGRNRATRAVTRPRQ